MNESIGWLWIHIGIVSGALLGTGFLKPGFLGGYDSPQRRLLRLGHISFFGLGALNILCARTLPAIDAASASVASAAFIVAALSMPVACMVVAFRQSLFPVFVLPVSSAVLATGLIAWGVCQ